MKNVISGRSFFSEGRRADFFFPGVWRALFFGEGLWFRDAAALRRAASAGCDFAFLSPVFSPRSKPGDVRPTLGLSGLEQLCASAPLPVIALGGIGPAQASDCLRAGAAGIACIGAIFAAGDIVSAARRMRRACGPTAVVG